MQRCFPHHVLPAPERQNLTLRMSQRRFTRLTNAFLKKRENHALSVALHYMHYNFCRIHRTLRVTPAMAAGVTDMLLEIADIVRITDEYEVRRRRWPSNYRTVGIYMSMAPRSMKLALIAIGLLATTGVVYAACVFC
jgi:hypothetical protein